MTGIRYVVFVYDAWDDDKGPGWDSMFHKSQALSLGELRNELSQKARDELKYIGEDYHVVEWAILEVVERGKVDSLVVGPNLTHVEFKPNPR